MKAAGMVLVILGILALVYGGFSYTKETHDADLGPLKIQVKDKDRVNVPVWAGVVPVHLAAEPSEYEWRRVHDGRVGAP